MPLVIVFVGSLLGLAVAGFPSRSEDAPLSVQTVTTTAPSTTTTPTTTAAPPSPAARQSGEIKVTAINSSTVTGAATKIGARLKSLGYVVQPPGADRKPQDSSVVMYREGLEAEGRALASSLGLDAKAIQPMAAPLRGARETDLAVLVGTDLAKSTP